MDFSSIQTPQSVMQRRLEERRKRHQDPVSGSLFTAQSGGGSPDPGPSDDNPEHDGWYDLQRGVQKYAPTYFGVMGAEAGGIAGALVGGPPGAVAGATGGWGVGSGVGQGVSQWAGSAADEQDDKAAKKKLDKSAKMAALGQFINSLGA